MSEHAVYVEFGGSKHRVGTAYQQQDGGFTLVLGGTLSLGPGQASSSRGGAPGASGAVFPNYGRSKGAPIFGASMQDLEFYANGCRRSLDNPEKARWHAKEQELLTTIEAEIARQGGSVPERREESYGGNRGEDDLPFR